MISYAGVCAVVVTYYPDTDIRHRIDRVAHQVNALIVVDNTPDPGLQQALEAQLGTVKNVHFIANLTNLGVSAALNQGLSIALSLGYKWLLTLDQDSCCYSNMAKSLMRVKEACVPTPVVIGGNYLDTRNDKSKVPVGDDGEFLEQKTVITSGCLVDACFAKKIGAFREDYFIDQVDHEFCLRARAHAGRVVISRQLVMEHSVGEIGGARIWGLGRLPKHPPLRKYYGARNSIVTIARYWFHEPTWCLYRGVRLMLGVVLVVLFEPYPLAKARAIAAGILDALAGRMGQARQPWLSDP